MSRKVNVRRRRPQAGSGDTKGRWKIYLLMSIFTSILVAGFFFAGRQHFSSIDYGIKNSRLRKQLDDLETEKRRLLLAREVSLSPGEIKKAARKLGVAESLSDGVELASSVKSGTSSPNASATAEQIAAPKTPSYSVVAASFTTTSGSKQAKPDDPDKSGLAERPRQIIKNTVAVR
jgi:hypothetical protein